MRKTIGGLLAVLFLSALLSGTAYARERYTDQDSHPLKIAYYVLYPVGKILEWVVFRPIQFVGSHLAGDSEECEESPDPHPDGR
ncbi:MAG: hypothetical protein ACE5E4_00635 [Candidatus Binatia bacterium]